MGGESRPRPPCCIERVEPNVAAHLLPITPDGNVMHFDLIHNATVGESMRLDNVDEWLITSSIQSIEPWVDDDAS